MRTATEAVIKLLGRTDGKTGGFFVMEGTQSHEVRAAFFQLHVTPHHVDDIDAVEEILDKRLWYHAGS